MERVKLCEESNLLTRNFQMRISKIALKSPIDPKVMNLISSEGIAILSSETQE